MRKLPVLALLVLLPAVALADVSGTVTPGVTPGSYAVLAGGALMVAAFFVRRLTAGWLHTDTGGLVIVLTSTVLTSCAEAVQRHGLSWSVLVTAAGSAALTFVAMSNTQKMPKGGGAA